MLPPVSLIQNCPVPFPQKLETNQDLARFTLALQEALDTCNVDKAALRRWSEEVLKKDAK